LVLRRGGVALAASLSLGLGLGLTSCTYFVFKLVLGLRPLAYTGAELVLLTLLAFVAWRSVRQEIDSSSESSDFAARPASLLEWIMAAAFWLGVGVYLSTYLSIARSNVHGQWDAWAMWNSRARFFYKGGDYWIDAFSPLLSWSNPDYPLLVPASVARAWTFMGAESWIAPAGFGLAMSLSLVFSVTLCVVMLRDRLNGYAAGLVLLGSTTFVQLSTAQCADVPLGCLVASTLILLALWDGGGGRADIGLLALAGMAAGLCAWTKNEGLIFVLAIIGARVATGLWQRQPLWRECRAFFAGLLPIAVVVAAFKLHYAPSSLLLTSIEPGTISERLLDPEHWLRVAGLFVRVLTAFEGGWPFVLLAVLVVSGFAIEVGMKRSVVAGVLALLVLCSSYFAIFLITPYEVDWHIDVALERLLTQVWPAGVLIYFMCLGRRRLELELERDGVEVRGLDPGCV
jgi:hypothetical protein